MSIQALSWVFKQKIRPSSLKFVLVSLADCANHDMLCWPSYAHIENVTSLDRKAIMRALESLKNLGYMIDTGNRCGRTNQIKIYRLNVPISNESQIGLFKQGYNGGETGVKKGGKQVPKGTTEPLLEPSFVTKIKKNDFEKKLLAAGFLKTELNYIVNIDDEIKGETNLIRCRSKFVADLLEQRCSYKLNSMYENKWRIEIAT